MFVFISGHSCGDSNWFWKIMKSLNFYKLENQPSIIFAWLINILYISLIAFFATCYLKIYLKYKNKTIS